MMRSVRRGLTTLVLLGAAVPALAQSSHTAAIVVTVHDASGAPVKDVAITVANAELNTSRDRKPGADGSATFTSLALTGTYTVSVRKPGASADDKTGDLIDDIQGLVLRADEPMQITVTLPAEGKGQVTIEGGAGRIRRDASVGLRLDPERMGETPNLGRRLTSLPLLDSAFRPANGTGDLYLNATYFVGGAGGREEPTFVVDGASGNEPRRRQTLFLMLPITAVQEMDVLTQPVSAEYGWTSGPTINLVTKSGGNTSHGDMYALGRPSRTESAAIGGGVCPSSIPTCIPTTISGLPITIRAPDVPDRILDTSAALGGPVMEDETFYFASVEFQKGTRTVPVTTLVAPDNATVADKVEQLLLDAKVDHKLSDTHLLTARINADRQSDQNPGDIASDNVVEGAGQFFVRRGLGAQVDDTRIRATLVQDTRVSYQQADPVSQLDPQSASIQLVRAGPVPFTSGESRNVLASSRQTEVAETLSWGRGAHTLLAGASATYAVSTANGTELGNDYPYGQFILNPASILTTSDLTLDDALSYSQSYNLGVTSASVRQWFATGFLQDTVRARANLTLSLGVRYDRQTSVGGAANLAPRAGLAWSPGHDGRTVVRASYGMYYSMILGADLASATLNGPNGIFVYTATPGQPGFPTNLSQAPVQLDLTPANLPPRDVTLLPGQRATYAAEIPGFDKIPDCGTAAATPLCYPSSLVNPRNQMISAGVERQLAPRLSVSVDYVHQHSSGIVQVVDLNAPSVFVRTAPGQVRSAADADLTRPIVPVVGGFRTVDVIENGGLADYDGLTTTVSFKTPTKLSASASYTLSRATNTAEPDGNGVGPNDQNQLGETERGPSLLDQRHRAVLTLTYALPHNFVIGTVTSLASGLPINATTGVDNNGDGLFNDRPVINGQVVGRSTFRGSPTADAAMFLEKRLKFTGGMFILRAEGTNMFNHANVVGRNAIYGDGSAPLATFGQAGDGMANLERGRTFQLIARLVF